MQTTLIEVTNPILQQSLRSYLFFHTGHLALPDKLTEMLIPNRFVTWVVISAENCGPLLGKLFLGIPALEKNL